jgi:tripartite-type tricarboxylate transporter receptor subunit TctC
MVRSSLGVVLGVCAVAATVTQAPAQEPFYKGKRLTLLVNFDAGSATDIDARVFARHFIKHVPGAPQLIVQNMAGGGGTNGTQYLGEVAPKDGSMVGFLTATAWNFASEPERFRVDFKTYEHVGYTGGTAVYYMRKDVPPGISKPADIMKAQGLISGGVNARTGRDISIRLTLDTLGVPFRHVTGYGSGERARLAMQRNEIHLYADTTPGYRGAVEGTMIKDGLAIPLWYDPHWDGKTFGKSKQVDGLPIKAYHEVYQDIHGKMPSGQHWEAYLALITLNGAMQRILSLPPGAPQAAVNALRAALDKLDHDKEFAAEATKILGFVPDYYAGPDTGDKIRNALTVPAHIRKFVAEYIPKGGKGGGAGAK